LSAEFARLRALIVDHRLEHRHALRELVVALGVGFVRLAESPLEAMGWLHRDGVDVAIIDNALPQGAIRFVRELRWNPRTPAQTLPVILVAEADEPTVVAARDAGVHEFLARPATLEHLRERFEEIFLRPRPFVRSPNYVGPCRRRRKLREWAGFERRRESDGIETARALARTD
jgi:CheY-like chemotaxis protein